MMPRNKALWQVEGLKEEHIPQIAAMERACFTDPWSESALRDELSSPLARYFVCTQGGQVLGYIGTRVVLDECQVANVAVSPACRREGVASFLMEAMLDFCRREGIHFVTLEVRLSNSAAQALYQKFGFQKQGLRPGYYQSPPEDAVLMSLEPEHPLRRVLPQASSRR